MPSSKQERFCDICGKSLGVWDDEDFQWDCNGLCDSCDDDVYGHGIDMDDDWCSDGPGDRDYYPEEDNWPWYSRLWFWVKVKWPFYIKRCGNCKKFMGIGTYGQVYNFCSKDCEEQYIPF